MALRLGALRIRFYQGVRARGPTSSQTLRVLQGPGSFAAAELQGAADFSRLVANCDSCATRSALSPFHLKQMTDPSHNHGAVTFAVQAIEPRPGGRRSQSPPSPALKHLTSARPSLDSMGLVTKATKRLRKQMQQRRGLERCGVAAPRRFSGQVQQRRADAVRQR